MLLLSAVAAAPHRDGPCLCIFDIDRTLTASQAAARKGSHNQCPAAHSFDHPYIKDTAYGGGGPLAFSEVGQHIENSFCKACWLGIISTGDAAGEGSSMRRELYKALDARGTQGARADQGRQERLGRAVERRDVAAAAAHVDPGGDEAGRRAAHSQVVRQRRPTIADSRVFMFDDKASNVAPFAASPYNARQVSCTTRDNDLGLCGAAPDEVVGHLGVSVCKMSFGKNVGECKRPPCAYVAAAAAKPAARRRRRRRRRRRARRRGRRRRRRRRARARRGRRLPPGRPPSPPPPPPATAAGGLYAMGAALVALGVAGFVVACCMLGGGAAREIGAADADADADGGGDDDAERQARREKRRAKREERERRHAGGRDAEEREMLAAPSSKEEREEEAGEAAPCERRHLNFTSSRSHSSAEPPHERAAQLDEAVENSAAHARRARGGQRLARRRGAPDRGARAGGARDLRLGQALDDETPRSRCGSTRTRRRAGRRRTRFRRRARTTRAAGRCRGRSTSTSCRTATTTPGGR